MASLVSYITYHDSKEKADVYVAETRDYYWGYGPRLVGITLEQGGAAHGKWRCHIEMMNSCD